MKRYRIYDPTLNELIAFYCDTKSNIWNWFFGFKMMYSPLGKWEYCDYIIPERIYKIALILSQQMEIKYEYLY